MAVVVSSFHYLFEKSNLGGYFKDFEEAVLRDAGQLGGQRDELPIIVDISSFRNKNEADPVTDRNALDRLLHELKARHVSTVGIDVDFSGEGGLPVDRNDLSRFRDWLHMNTGNFHLRLGVYRQRFAPRPGWLGRDEFYGLAAGIAMPTEDDSERMDLSHNFYYLSTGLDNSSSRLPQMAAALYQDIGYGQLSDSHRLLLPSVVRSGEIVDPRGAAAQANHLQFGKYRVDYSVIDQLQRERTIIYDRSGGFARDAPSRVDFNGAVVLVGDTRDSGDRICPPSASEPVPGVYVQAASLVTLERGGFAEVEGYFTTVLDALVILITSLGLVGLFVSLRRRSDKQRGMAEETVCILGAPLVFLAGFLLVRHLHIFWPDFIWVSAALLIHPFISDSLFRFLRVVVTSPFERLRSIHED
jgi:CHASE2 domain